MKYAFDCESYPMQHRLPAPQMVCLSVYSEEYGGQILRGADAVFWFREALERGHTLIGAFVAVDLAIMSRACEDQGVSVLPLVFRALNEGRIKDIQIREKLLSLARRGVIPEDVGLSTLFKRYTGEGLTGKGGLDAWRVRYNELDLLPTEDWPEAARSYSLLDSEATYRVYEAQRGAVPNEDEQVAADFSLYLMRIWGMKTDPERVAALGRAWREEHARLKAELIREGVLRPDGVADTAFIRALVTFAYNGRPPRTDPTARHPRGQVKTDAPTIKRAPSTEPRLKVLQTFNKVHKNLSTYLTPLEDRATVHPRYDVLKTTGRTSAKGPNIQNQTQGSGVRECFIPRPGCVLASADWCGQEDRSLAQSMYSLGLNPLSQARYVADPNYDPHSALGVRLLGYFYGIDITYAEFRGILHDPRHEHYDRVKDCRKKAKPCVFGFPGGMVPATFLEYARGYGLELTLAEAEALRGLWLADDPARGRYLAMCKRETQYGRRTSWTTPHSGRKRANCGYTQRANTPFQAQTADGAKAALFFVAWSCYDPEGPVPDLYGARPWVFVHDEIAVECHEDICQRVRRGLERAMDIGMGIYHPDVPCITEANIARRWSKDAHSTVLENGDLTIWEEC